MNRFGSVSNRDVVYVIAAFGSCHRMRPVLAGRLSRRVWVGTGWCPLARLALLWLLHNRSLPVPPPW